MFALASTILLAAAVPTTVVTHVDDFDLAKVPRQTASCANRDPSGDIVVCAPKGMNFSIPDVRRFVEKPVRATFVGPL